MRQTTVVATIFFAVYYVIYTQGWVDARALSEAVSGL